MPRLGVEFLIRHRCGHWSRYTFPGYLTATTALVRVHCALCPECRARAPTSAPPKAS